MSGTRTRSAVSQRARIIDVADAAGVARSTAALALQASPRLRPETVAAVRAAADRLGYVYDRGAARLRSGRSRTVGLLVCEITNAFYAELTAGVQATLEAAGFATLLANTDESLDRQRLMLERFREYHADGVLMVPASGTPATLMAEIGRWRLPCVTMVRGFRRGVHAGTDNAAGTALATRHLIGLQRRHIAFLGGATVSSTSEGRRAGYLAAMAEAGLPPQLLPCRTEIGDAADVVAALPMDDLPQGFVCFNDAVAFGATIGLARRGLAAGRDAAVVGFDDIRDAARWHPPLTTVRAPASEIGAAAARLLLDRIADPDLPARRITIVPQLVIRSSCGAA